MQVIYFIVLLLSALCVVPASAAEEKVINFYNWSAYTPDSVIKMFEQETGIRVNYSTFDSNETMYSKLKAASNSRYDIIVPSNYFIDRMANEGMLIPLDKSKLPNLKYLDSLFLNQGFDPNNRYSLPYLWGTTGIVVNKYYFSNYNAIKSWKDFWKAEYDNKLMLLNDSREVFSMALLSLGYSINDRDPEHLKQVYDQLLKLLPNIKLFNNDAVANTYIDEDATIGMAWNGDAYLSIQENANLVYNYPEEGFVIWIDNFAIPRNAPHPENSYKFINFLLRPDISKMIAMEVGFSTPNTEAYKLLPETLKSNPILYPSHEILKRGQYQRYVGSATPLYQKYWELLKTR